MSKLQAGKKYFRQEFRETPGNQRFSRYLDLELAFALC